MESLQKWSNILRDHVKKLNIPEAKRDEFMKRQYRAFQRYQDPDENLNLTNSSSTSGKKGTTPVANAAPLEADDDSVLLPLDPFILNKNIGLPIAVIVTKVILVHVYKCLLNVFVSILFLGFRVITFLIWTKSSITELNISISFNFMWGDFALNVRI